MAEADLLQNWADDLFAEFGEALERNDDGHSRLDVFVGALFCYQADPGLWAEMLERWYAGSPDGAVAARQQGEQASAGVRESYGDAKRKAQVAQDG